MPRKRRPSKARRPVLPAGLVHYLETGVYADIDTLLDVRIEGVRSTWDAVGEELVASWIDERPGTRPWAWWRFDAPRSTTWPEWKRATCPAPRLQLGGSGEPAWARLAYAVHLELGVPAVLARVDRADPPVFESEAEYLNRHDLLGEDERERLPDDALRPLVLDVSAVPDAWLAPPCVVRLTPQAVREGRVRQRERTS